MVEYKYLVLPYQRYTVDQLNKVKDIIKKDPEKHAQEIADEVGLTARQIKKIRLLFLKGTKEDIDLLYTCKYYITSIISGIKYRSKCEKMKQKFEERQQKQHYTSVYGAKVKTTKKGKRVVQRIDNVDPKFMNRPITKEIPRLRGCPVKEDYFQSNEFQELVNQNKDFLNLMPEGTQIENEINSETKIQKKVEKPKKTRIDNQIIDFDIKY